jgi:hypothetical protein
MFEKLMAEARHRNRQRDAFDRSNGFVVPHEGPMKAQLATIREALIAGTQLQNWEIICEGIDLLEQVMARVLPDASGNGGVLIYDQKERD